MKYKFSNIIFGLVVDFGLPASVEFELGLS